MQSEHTVLLVAAQNPLSLLYLIGATLNLPRFMQVMRDSHGSFARPIVLALSNPNSVAECTAREAYDWSEGSAIYASGTTFPAFQVNGGETYRPSQANNSLIFPGEAAPHRLSDRTMALAGLTVHELCRRALIGSMQTGAAIDWTKLAMSS